MPTYLLTWNPTKYHWDDLQENIRQLESTGEFLINWSVGNTHKVDVGDRVFMMRQGPKDPGIVASGTVIERAKERPHWDVDKRTQGKTDWGVWVRFDTILDASREPILPRAELKSGILQAVHWDTERSGIRIPDDIARALELRWAQLTGKTVAASNRTFGHIPGSPPGTTFPNRQALHNAGVHRPLQAGISGSGEEGADSIVISGGYEDDQDDGDEIVYTGHVGRDPNTGQQVADQTLTVGNLALAKNHLDGLPVRVIRGNTQLGYRYDGLYSVDDYWHEKGKAGFLVYRFRLAKIPDSEPTTSESTQQIPISTDQPQGAAARKETRTLRVVRDTKRSRNVKQHYKHHCQICNIQLMGPIGPYSEAAHIKPLGKPHNGPDHESNILCLCPNHHVLFDLHAFAINDDLTLIGIAGSLIIKPSHNLNSEYLKYHRDHYMAKNT